MPIFQALHYLKNWKTSELGRFYSEILWPVKIHRPQSSMNLWTFGLEASILPQNHLDRLGYGWDGNVDIDPQ